MTSRTQLGYSALGACSVAIGLANSVLTLRMLGVSGESDVWLLSLAIVATFTFLSQLGVDQFLIFYEHERALGVDRALVFAQAACQWAIVSGVVFAILVAFISPIIVQFFAVGQSGQAKESASNIVIAMAAQIAAAPLAHVVRQYLNAQGRYVLSYIVGLWAPLVMTILLLYAYLISGAVSSLAWLVGAGGALQMILCFALVWPQVGVPARPRGYWLALRPFIVASIAMRTGHALHNFFSALIINSTLSALAPGSISIFQYASRFASATAGIAVGPQGGILNAQVSRGWAENNRSVVTTAAKDFVKRVLPILLVVVATVWVFLPTLIRFLVPQKMPLDDLALVFLILSCWYGIIQLEAVFVAIVVAARRASFFIAVNGLFVVIFYLLSQIALTPWEHADLPLAATAAQLVSIALYASLARLMIGVRFTTNPSTRSIDA